VNEAQKVVVEWSHRHAWRLCYPCQKALLRVLGEFFGYGKPRPVDPKALYLAIYARHAAGCCLHNTLDDLNVDDASVRFVLGEARSSGHADCIALAQWLLAAQGPGLQEEAAREDWRRYAIMTWEADEKP
jgi:hypothetical protein